MKNKLSIIIAATFILSLTSCVKNEKEDGAEIARQAKITMSEAISKVVQNHNGFIVEAELEKKKDKLFYEIDLIQNGKEMEVLVDAVTGEISELMED